MANGRPQLLVHRLGRMGYEAATRLQERLVGEHISYLARPPLTRMAVEDAVGEARPERTLRMARPPHRLLLVEHAPAVFTMGKRATPGSLLASPAELSSWGAQVVRSDRGGDVTLHCPGQLVGYPILDLRDFRKDLRWFVRSVELAIADAAATHGVTAFPGSKGREGVWVADNRKLAAVGLRVSRWITKHGFAINCEPPLPLFDLMVPCGLVGVSSTSMTAENVTGARIRVDAVASSVVTALSRRLQCDVVESPSLLPRLDDF